MTRASPRPPVITVQSMLVSPDNEDPSARRLRSRGTRAKAVRVPGQRFTPDRRRHRRRRPLERRAGPDRPRAGLPLAPRPRRRASPTSPRRWRCARSRRPLTIASLEPGRQGAAHVDLQRHGLAGLHQAADRRRARPAVPRAAGGRRAADRRPVVTPVAVTHTVPTSGFIVHDGVSGVGLLGRHRARPRRSGRRPGSVGGLGAIILECAFPNRLEPPRQHRQAHDPRADPPRARQDTARRARC